MKTIRKATTVKPHWQIHRQMIPQPDGQQRWDRAYQLLLQWGNPSTHEAQSAHQIQEKQDEPASCPVCTGLDSQSEPGSDN
jgi:hypothetical protein